MANIQKYQLHKDVLLTDVDSEMVLLDMRNGQYYGLNSVGCDIVKLINDGKTLNETKQEISHRYQIDKQTAQNDIAELVADLQKQNLLFTKKI